MNAGPHRAQVFNHWAPRPNGWGTRLSDSTGPPWGRGSVVGAMKCTCYRHVRLPQIRGRENSGWRGALSDEHKSSAVRKCITKSPQNRAMRSPRHRGGFQGRSDRNRPRWPQVLPAPSPAATPTVASRTSPVTWVTNGISAQMFWEKSTFYIHGSRNPIKKQPNNKRKCSTFQKCAFPPPPHLLPSQAGGHGSVLGQGTGGEQKDLDAEGTSLPHVSCVEQTSGKSWLLSPQSRQGGLPRQGGTEAGSRAPDKDRGGRSRPAASVLAPSWPRTLPAPADCGASQRPRLPGGSLLPSLPGQSPREACPPPAPISSPDTHCPKSSSRRCPQSCRKSYSWRRVTASPSHGAKPCKGRGHGVLSTTHSPYRTSGLIHFL